MNIQIKWHTKGNLITTRKGEVGIIEGTEFNWRSNKTFAIVNFGDRKVTKTANEMFAYGWTCHITEQVVA